MTPKELYEREPEGVSNDLNILFASHSNHSHVPEISEVYHWFTDEENSKNEKIRIQIIKEFEFDSRRYWRLATVWFEDKPVMVIRNAGREGDDHVSRFITDQELYKEMVVYLRTFIPIEFDNKDIVDENTDIKDLTEFYGNELDGYFEKHRY